MKIVVACKGRAHLLDCCRELQKRGHDAVFYTTTPKKNFKKYGLQKGGVSLLPILAPFVLLAIYVPCDFTRDLYSRAIDVVVAWLMPKCDVFIGASPDFFLSMKKARTKWGTKIILDRGASHVRIFNEMSMLSGQQSMTEKYMKKDESQYNYVDYIALGSDYMLEGFVQRGISKEKLFSNPYGVSFKDFHPTICTNEYDCIYVGRWSKRKGCNLIVDAIQNTNIKFLHVGALDDMTFPKEKNFCHIEPVPQSELLHYYQKSKVFIFPSFDDGFGMVLCQAFACGLPIVCSKNCGGTTMVRLMKEPDNIFIMDKLTKNCLYENIIRALNKSDDYKNKIRDCNQMKLTSFSWKAYGERFDNFIQKIIR